MSTPSFRMVLEGVPRVGFYQGGPRCPEDIPFPSVMSALMKYFKEEDFGCRWEESNKPGCTINCSYSYFIGVSGVAAFLSWKRGWEYDNADIRFMSGDPREPLDRALQATGFTYELVCTEEGRDNKMLFREKILESIQKGHPVLAFGPVGPPEAGMITGFDEGGDVLIGWSYFQTFPEFSAGLEFEPSGEFRKRHWFEDSPGLSFILIGEKKERPPLREIYRGALEWLLQVTHTPLSVGGRNNGLAAYTAWARQLLCNDDFPQDETIVRQRHDVHNTAVSMVAEARWYGSQFLIQASNPEILNSRVSSDLLHASACYAAEHQLMWDLWNLTGGNGNPDAFRYFADPAIRRRMVPIIHEALEKDARAVEHIERALGRL